MSREAIAHELAASARILGEVTGERPIHFAPPGGLYSRIVVQEAHRAGYRFFRTMNWGYNRRLRPMAIAVVPMTNGAGMRFLESALRGRGEWTLKLLCNVKNTARGIFPRYGSFRSSAMQRLGK
jgi:peptidoglycan/xylan/chitin deacetylase (PgdA/CDA1 family)